MNRIFRIDKKKVQNLNWYQKIKYKLFKEYRNKFKIYASSGITYNWNGTKKK